MYKHEIIELLTTKLNKYQDYLEEIEDRLDTMPPYTRDDMQRELDDLYRSFEDLESRLDELENMTESEVLDEEEIINEKMEILEDSLSEYMENLHRVSI